MANQESGPKRGTFQLRVADEQQRKRWQESAETQAQAESKWARDGLDAWVGVCARARELNANPRELLETALADHARVRAALAELLSARSISDTERNRLLRVLAPTEWARLESLK
jgi:hypothetical protein